MTKLIQFLDKGAYTHAEISTGDRTVSTFRQQFARDLLGRPEQPHARGIPLVKTSAPAWLSGRALASHDYAATHPSTGPNPIRPQTRRKEMIYLWQVLRTEPNTTSSVNSTLGIGCYAEARARSTNDFLTVVLFALTMIAMDSVYCVVTPTILLLISSPMLLSD